MACKTKKFRKLERATKEQYGERGTEVAIRIAKKKGWRYPKK